MRLGIVRLQFQCPAAAGDRFIQSARLVRNHAQKMDRIDLIRLHHEDLPVETFGSLQTAGLVVFDGDRQ